MKLTTGYEFQGYFITDYYDVIFDEMLVGLGLGKSFLKSLASAVELGGMHGKKLGADSYIKKLDEYLLGKTEA